MQPDLPLIYVSVASMALLVYFIAYVDATEMARVFVPLELHNTEGVSNLDTGFAAAAGLLLGFFVWLLHALLFDLAGMVVGLPPAAVTGLSAFCYRVIERSSLYPALAVLAIIAGLFFGSRAAQWERRRRRRVTMGERTAAFIAGPGPAGKAALPSAKSASALSGAPGCVLDLSAALDAQARGDAPSRRLVQSSSGGSVLGYRAR